MIEAKEELKPKKDRLFVCDGKLMMKGKKMGWDGGGVSGVGNRNLCVLRFLVLVATV